MVDGDWLFEDVRPFPTLELQESVIGVSWKTGSTGKSVTVHMMVVMVPKQLCKCSKNWLGAKRAKRHLRLTY
jgi:hypothetical protein